MCEEILKLISDIQILSIQVSTTTKADVFLNYSGHVNLLEISCYKDGWNKDNEEQAKYYYKDLYMNIYSDKTILRELIKSKETLEGLLNE